MQSPRICPTCEKEFVVTTYNRRTYCSVHCYRKDRNKKDKLQGFSFASNAYTSKTKGD